MKVNELKVERKELFADAKTGKLLEVFDKDEYMASETFTINGEKVELYSEAPVYEDLWFIVFGDFAIDIRTGKVYKSEVIEVLNKVNSWSGGENYGSGCYEIALTDDEIEHILSGHNAEDVMKDCDIWEDETVEGKYYMNGMTEESGRE